MITMERTSRELECHSKNNYNWTKTNLKRNKKKIETSELLEKYLLHIPQQPNSINISYKLKESYRVSLDIFALQLYALGLANIIF